MKPKTTTKRHVRFLLAISLFALLPGCATTYADRGALAGGAIGAGTGAIIGASSGAAGPGAIIGAGIGLLSGAIIGSGLDEVNARAHPPETRYETVCRTAPPPPPPLEPPLTIDDVIRLSSGGVSEDVIINRIERSGTSYALSTEQILTLHEAGVSDRVITFMNSYRAAPVRTEVYTVRRTVYPR